VTPFIAYIDAFVEDILQDSTKHIHDIHENTEIHLYYLTRRVDDFLLLLPALRKIHDHPLLQRHIRLHLHLTTVDAKALENNAVFLFRWAIQLQNQLLRSRMNQNNLALPIAWLYKKPLDLLGLRYLADSGEVSNDEDLLTDAEQLANEQDFERMVSDNKKGFERQNVDGEVKYSKRRKSSSKSRRSINISHDDLRDHDAMGGQCMHAMAFGRPDFGFEVITIFCFLMTI
jgi:hypothetical protein